MAEEPVVRLVGVPQEHAGGDLTAHGATRAYGGRPDRVAEDAGVGADPERAFKPAARPHFYSALEHHGPGPRVEYDTGFDQAFGDGDQAGVADDGRAGRDPVGSGEQAAKIFAEQGFEYGQKPVHTMEDDAWNLDGPGLSRRPVPAGPCGHTPADGHPSAHQARRFIGQGGREAARSERRGTDDGGTRDRLTGAHGR